MRKRKMANALQMEQIMLLLREHCHRVGEFAVYDEDWGDDRIHSECLTSEHTIAPVQNLRKTLIGNVRARMIPAPAHDSSAIEVRVLDARVTALESSLSSLRKALGLKDLPGDD